MQDDEPTAHYVITIRMLDTKWKRWSYRSWLIVSGAQRLPPGGCSVWIVSKCSSPIPRTVEPSGRSRVEFLAMILILSSGSRPAVL